MTKRAGLFRRISGAVVLAVMVLSTAAPALAADDDRRGHRVIEDDAGRSVTGVEWTRLQAIDLFGVEWTLRD